MPNTFTGDDWLTGLHTGAQLGQIMSHNRLEQEKIARLAEQTKFANDILQRKQAIDEAEAARAAQQFQQLNDFATLVRQTTPGGGDFEAMTPEDQSQARATMRQRQLSQAPPALLPRLLGQEQSDFEKEQRLNTTLREMESRRAATQAEIDARRQASIDAGFARQDVSIAAARDAAKQAQDAAMERERFRQGEIGDRAGMRKKAVAEEFPLGTPAAIYENLLTAKESGGESGAVKDGIYKEGAREGIFTGPTALDTLIEQYAPKVPAATKRRIEAKVHGGATQGTTESEGEAAAIPVPTEPVPANTAPAKVMIRVITPDGKAFGHVPEDKLEAALKKGYKRAD